MADKPDTITGAAGTVRSTSITSDSQSTTMRTGKDLQDLAKFLERDVTCANRTNAMAGIFNYRGVAQQFRKR